jgi:5-methylcytosine-specific restriction endonuclease McrA
LAALLVLFVVIAIIITAIAWKIKYRKRKRKGFPYYIRERILDKQGHKCAHCKKVLNKLATDFDHKNGNRSDNSESNCVALCPNCSVYSCKGQMKYSGSFRSKFGRYK